MTNFQAVELLLQHGKRYVSFNYKLGGSAQEAWEQVRLGWKAANCEDLVRHAGAESNKSIKDRDTVLRGRLDALVVPASHVQDVDLAWNGVEGGVGEELFLDESG